MLIAMLRSFLAVFLLGCAAVSPALAQQRPVVQTSAGEVRGVRDNGISAFRGIPYAAAPVGALRWRPPAAPAAWSGVREAAEYGDVCPQPQGVGQYQLQQRPMSEDCLSVNVFSPNTSASAGLPVMVWIHGGAFRIGAGGVPLYDGSALARRGVVVVTMNYRLGLLGIFDHADLETEQAGQPRSNYALMDQTAALEWVRDNIARFGGDPARVTLFGESAGGVSVMLHMMSERSNGLFHQAIIQSGGGWTRSPDRASALALGARVSETLGAPDMAALRAVSSERLVEVLGQLTPPLGYTPIVDGDLVRETIPDAFAAGRFRSMPMMVGANTYEQNLIAGESAAPARRGMVALAPADQLAALRALYGAETPDDDALGGALFRDGGFVGPARWVAQRNQASSFVYRYAHIRVAQRGEVPGAGHGAEVPYVFDSLAAISPAARLLWRGQDRRMARVLGDCWVSFAKDGVPSCGADWRPISGAPQQVMIFDDGAAVFADDPWASRLDIHEALFRARPRTAN